MKESAERYQREGDKCDDIVSDECRYDGSGEEEGGDNNESTKRFDERRDTEPVRVTRKVLSDVYADMGWMLPLNKLKIPASPLSQKSSHECASETQHKAKNPSRVHEHDRSREVV